MMWSLRERGCSVPAGLALLLEWVVPARAGVFRGTSPRSPSSPRGPCASGGVPSTSRSAVRRHSWSLRERGCSALSAVGGFGEAVVPARAGVFRAAGEHPLFRWSGPCASGGVPVSAPPTWPPSSWSLRERGCSDEPGPHVRLPAVVPARAGVFRSAWAAARRRRSGPCASGGVPAMRRSLDHIELWSLREQGCSLRGWPTGDPTPVVPARAGVFRHRGQRRQREDGGPCASGGVPQRATGHPLYALWSLRERGCSERGRSSSSWSSVVPARAGVFRNRHDGYPYPLRGPCASGGVPPEWP